VAWTTPTIRATGDLITAAIYNADIINNLKAVGPIKRGSDSVTFTGGGSQSGVTTVTHGLGTTPTAVHVTPGARSGVTLTPTMAVTSISSTQFSVDACTVDGSSPVNGSTVAFTWTAG
jgi:hypothetical protein